MENLISIALNSVFVGNILLAYFLGMCSFLAVSKNMQTAVGLGFAVIFVMVMASFFTFLIYKIKIRIDIQGNDPDLKRLVRL